jgi:uncharacterized membrane protein
MTLNTNKKRTFGEKCADLMRHGMGTWTFLIVFCTAMVLWILSAGFGIDPAPFFRLNLVLSMVAGLQGSVLLISAKRADRISDEMQKKDTEHSVKDYQLDLQTHALVQEIHEMLKDKE